MQDFFIGFQQSLPAKKGLEGDVQAYVPLNPLQKTMMKLSITSVSLRYVGLLVNSAPLVILPARKVRTLSPLQKVLQTWFLPVRQYNRQERVFPINRFGEF